MWQLEETTPILEDRKTRAGTAAYLLNNLNFCLKKAGSPAKSTESPANTQGVNSSSAKEEQDHCLLLGSSGDAKPNDHKMTSVMNRCIKCFIAISQMQQYEEEHCIVMGGGSRAVALA